jgi:hypothetical protein
MKQTFFLKLCILLRMTEFSDTATKILVEVDRRFRGTHCLHYQGYFLMMEAVHISKTSVYFETPRCYIP